MLSIHCHRGQEVGPYVRRVDFGGDRWTPFDEKIIWGTSMGQQTRDKQKFHEFASSIRFGQASLLRLSNREILATHWCVIEGLGRIIMHRLRETD